MPSRRIALVRDPGRTRKSRTEIDFLLFFLKTYYFFIEFSAGKISLDFCSEIAIFKTPCPYQFINLASLAPGIDVRFEHAFRVAIEQRHSVQPSNQIRQVPSKNNVFFQK